MKELWKSNNQFFNQFFSFVGPRLGLTAEKNYKEFIINMALRQSSLELLFKGNPNYQVSYGPFSNVLPLQSLGHLKAFGTDNTYIFLLLLLFASF